MLVMFDLPVVEKEDRKAATGFRNYLLDQGFTMGQYSVYYRLLSGRDSALAMERKITTHLPPDGAVNVLLITDKQYENMKIFQGRSRQVVKKPDQLTFF